MNAADKKIFGLIGFPVKHSLSPLMHNAAFKALKIDAEYRLFPLQDAEVDDFLKALADENIRGLNVTVPYKQKVIPFLNRVSAEAGLIGAVNTIKVSADGLEGFNTDGEGFLRHLRQDLAFDPQGSAVALLGAGGAARAVSVYLCKAGARRVFIYDTDKPKMDELVKSLSRNFKDVEIKAAASLEDLHLGDAGLLVNATPLGMKEGDPLPIDKGLLKGRLLAYDLIYNPPESRLLKAAKEAGCRISNGLGMLLYQGAASFEIWTGRKAPLEVMREALQQGVEKI